MVSKVLVVDDSPAELQNLKTILSDAGCVVSTATSGSEAVKKALSEKPNVIFMDVIMPEMDGFAATRELSANAATKTIPVVFVTSMHRKPTKCGRRCKVAKAMSPNLIRPIRLLNN